MKTKRLSFSAMMAALATVLMLVGYFPYLTYAVPCVASLPIMVVLIELNKKSAIYTYIASILPVFLFCEPESKLLYLCFVGFYPVLKAVFEGLKSRALEFVLKFVSFNLGVVVIYLLSKFVFGISFEDLGELGRYGAVIFLVLANLVFLAYDFCLSKMAVYYMYRLHLSVQKLLK